MLIFLIINIELFYSNIIYLHKQMEEKTCKNMMNFKVNLTKNDYFLKNQAQIKKKAEIKLKIYNKNKQLNNQEKLTKLKS